MTTVRREEGFTIIEMVVTAMILTLGALATFGLLSVATKNTQRAKGTQVALDRAQQELEALRSLSTEEIALKWPASHSVNELSPDYRVSGGMFAATRQPPSEYSPLVVNGDKLETGGVVEKGTIDPGPVPFTSGDVKGEVYRYVVWRDDTTCGAACPRSQDYKQIVVAVKLDRVASQGGERGYVEVQSDFIDPTDSASNDPLPGSEEEATGQQFFLSDTPCARSGATERQPITGDHLLHNTLGTCADGPHTGTEPGAPDALLLSSPPDPAPEDPSDPPLYDYSNDSYLDTAPDTAKGVQIRPDDSADCRYVPTASEHPESRVHRWLSDPMASKFTMTGDATLEFYSRTLNDTLTTGTVCAYLYRRHETGGGTPVPEDTLLTDTEGGAAYWTFTPSPEETWNGFWPRFRWATLRLKMSFNGAPVPAGDRLGVALSVELANTPVDAIPIMYDHPLYSTRIEIDTTTPIEGG
jgi:type II secretory pathway pseudopilin PulG